jgi:protein ImuB
MKRFASVWLPAWPIERLQRADPRAVPADRPFGLVETGTHGILLTAVNAMARASGIHPDQSLADARAILPTLATRKAERARDRAALIHLSRWSGRYGPVRNVEGDRGLGIDVTGVAHLFGGETALMADLVHRLRGFSLTARAGLADTPGAAAALARFAPLAREAFAIAPVGRTQETLSRLPVEALDLAGDTVLLLKRLGLRRIGQLYDLPRAALARRFQTIGKGRDKAKRAAGIAGAVLTKLDLALGLTPDARSALVEPPSHLVRSLFADPLISADGIAHALEDLAGHLCQVLDQAAIGARRLHLCLYRADGTMAEVWAGTSRPSRDPKHLITLMTDKVATIDAGFGIDAITLAATAVEPLDPIQAALASRLEPHVRSDPAALIDKLSNRLGPERVFRLVPVESHIPERAEIRIPALRTQTRVAAAQPSTARIRPSLLFPAPELITVLATVPDGPPAWFTWRRLNHTVARAEGPERIEPEWWHLIGRKDGFEKSLQPRDYYRIEDDHGGRYWVFREGLYEREAEAGAPRWYMHGVFG